MRAEEAHKRVAADRIGVGRSRVAARKRAEEAHNRVVADHTRAVGQSRVATHKHTAMAHNQVAAGSHPGLRHDQEMRSRRAALRRWQSQCKGGA